MTDKDYLKYNTKEDMNKSLNKLCEYFEKTSLLTDSLDICVKDAINRIEYLTTNLISANKKLQLISDRCNEYMVPPDFSEDECENKDTYLCTISHHNLACKILLIVKGE